MQSQRWMFTSPGGEDEYKKPSVTREHFDAVFEAKAREKSLETENGKLHKHKIMPLEYICNLSRLFNVAYKIIKICKLVNQFFGYFEMYLLNY